MTSSQLNNKFANRASQSATWPERRDRLHDRFLVLLQTGGANVMNGLSATASFLYAESERSTSQSYQFVTLLLCVPVHKIHQLAAAFTFAVLDRRQLLIDRHYERLGIDNPLKGLGSELTHIVHILRDQPGVPEAKRCLRDITERLDGLESASNSSNINHGGGSFHQGMSGNLSVTQGQSIRESEKDIA